MIGKEIIKSFVLGILIGSILLICEQGLLFVTQRVFYPLQYWLIFYWLVYGVLGSIAGILWLIIKRGFLSKNIIKFVIAGAGILVLICSSSYLASISKNKEIILKAIILISLNIAIILSIFLINPERILQQLFALAIVLLLFISWALLFPEAFSFNSELALVWHCLNSVLLFIIFFYFLSIPEKIIYYLTMPVLLLSIGFSFSHSTLKEHLEPKVSLSSSKISVNSSSFPDIILIVLDTARKENFSLYGYPRKTTPFLEELAKTSQVYTNMISAAPWTPPSHASLFTGLFPRTHHIHNRVKKDNFYPKLSNEAQTLAEILHSLGYQTIAVVANIGFLSPESGLLQGFQIYHTPKNPWSGAIKIDLIRIIACISDQKLASKVFKPYFRAEDINKITFHTLQNIDSRPLFLFLNYMDVHEPLYPPPPYHNLFSGRNLYYFLFHHSQTVLDLREGKKIDPKIQKHLISQYDGSLAYLDAQLKLLFEELKKIKRFNSALIIITSDHGEYLGEHNFLAHHNVYEEVLRIPLIIRLPNGKNSGVYHQWVQTVDIFPTILAYLKLPIPKGIEGKPIPTVLSNNQPNTLYPDYVWKYPFAEYYASLSDEVIEKSRYPSWYARRYGTNYKAIYVDKYKLITSSRFPPELYDLTLDPKEKNNLAKEFPQLVTEYTTLLQQFLEHPSPLNIPEEEVFLKKEQIKRLKALGYLR